MKQADKIRKQIHNARARKRYIETMKIVKQEPIASWRSLNALQCRNLCEQAFNGANKRQKRKMLRLIGATKSQIQEMV